MAFVGSDAASEVVPTLVEGVNLPVHTLVITALGINILDNQDLERLSETAARLQAVGVHADDQPGAGDRGDWLAAEYARGVLIEGRTQAFAPRRSTSSATLTAFAGS